MVDKHLVIGTAGHVDHGKTALIKALTGINTDRLREEQERGMSIELGFAHFTLPCGMLAGIVDVPGHERFLRNMLAGAAGMDMVMLVVAADEGVMPQTVEHLDILRMLQVKDGIVVVTKVDLVDEEWITLVEEEIRTLVKGSLLEGAPVIRVSSVTGQGLDALVEALNDRALRVQARSSEGPFRMPVDRVFTMPGFGTVVAGTVWNGVVRVGDPLELQPSGVQSRARGLQMHGRKVEQGPAGVRLAVNLVGVEVGQVYRGAVLSHPGLLKASTLLDVHLELLDRLAEPLRHRTRIRVHIGTAEVIGRLALLDRDELLPGDACPAQFQLESPVAALRGDRFIVRLYSPMVLLGGGAVLDPNPRRHKRHDERTLARLQVLKGGSLEAQVAQVVLDRGLTPVSAEEVAAAMGCRPEQAEELLAELEAHGDVTVIGERYLHADAVREARDRVERALAEFHRQRPLRQGMPKEELRSRSAARCDAKLWNTLLDIWAGEGTIRLRGALVALGSHEVTFSEDERRAAGIIEDAYRSGWFDPPAQQAVLEQAGGVWAKEVFAALVEQGRLVKIAEGLYLHVDAVSEAERKVREMLAAQGALTVAEFRDAIGSSRKVVVPLLEYFDSVRVTRRCGDVRVLAGDR
ncbi:MAG: selenocysteine-specific translation elongation factor [Armatimonadota bacterium]